jgi:hypothetical protein
MTTSNNLEFNHQQMHGRLAHSAINSATLINGGAAVALLAFIGHIATADASDLTIDPFAPALYTFALGVFFGAMANGTQYLGELFLTREQRWIMLLGRTSRLATFALLIAAYGAFLRGAQSAYLGFFSGAN